MKFNPTDTLQKYLKRMCDGDWEHVHGIRIATIDNPGWSVEIDLPDQDFEDCLSLDEKRETSDVNWIDCRIEDGKFFGFGGPENLSEILSIFDTWISKNHARDSTFQ